MPYGHDGEEADHGGSADGADGSQVADPFAEGKAADVEDQQEEDDEQGGGSGEGLVVCEFLYARAGDVDAYSYTGEDDGGEIDDVG